MQGVKHRTKASHRAWGKVIPFASFACMFLVTVVIRCTGMLYVSWQNAFESTAAQTGAISSVTSSTLYFSSLLAGVICNRYGYRVTCSLGGLLTFFPLLMSFWVSNLWGMYSIAALIGVGTSLCNIANNAILADYYEKYFPIISSISMSGVGINMIAFPPLLRVLLDTYGWRGAMLVTSAICANLCVVGALYRPYSYTPRTPRFEGAAVHTDVSPTTDGNSNGIQNGSRGIYDITGNFSTVFYVLTGLLSATVLQMMLFPLFRKIEPGIPERDESQNA
ncbi:monocarboxylate transporter 13-like [Acanthaster planci]|uniref:Monocarboxylate transporter 13-like n=1 Tax=Acanthaster planci TaxID=133434 RepID=A0A8B7ZHE6_ACAPL|nr:monocarboxylate transporter 13-like [Acanthaster planci]